MRKAGVFMHGIHAGVLEEITPRIAFRFTYELKYDGPPVSLSLPVRKGFHFSLKGVCVKQLTNLYRKPYRSALL